MTSKLLDWTGERWIITLSKKTGSETLNQIKIKNKDCDFEKLRNSESYKKAISVFPDLEIIDVKNLEDECND